MTRLKKIESYKKKEAKFKKSIHLDLTAIYNGLSNYVNVLL